MGSLQENQKFCEYLEKSVTPFHCVLNSEKILNQNGFCELNTESKWKLKKGGKYYWKFNDSYLFAFSVGTMWSEGQGFKLAAAHGDSPCFRIRSGKDKRMGQYVFLNTEGYGGANFTSWIDRPLSVAGRVCLKSKYDKKVDVRILDMERAIAIIPGLAVHFTKEDYEYQEKNSKRIPLFAITENTEMSDKMFEKMVADELEVEPEDILDYELYVYHYAKSEIIGMKEELLASPRLDNQTGTYGIIQAIAGTENETGISAAVIFDNEEVGNISKNGAFSRVTSTILKLIYNLFIWSDDVHCDLMRTNQKYIPVASICDYKKIVTLTSLSKTFNLAGLYITNIIFEDIEMKEKYVQKCLGASASPFDIVLVETAYTRCENWLIQLREYLDDNLKWAVERLRRNIPGVKCTMPEGSYIIWVDFEKCGMSEEEVRSRIIDKANVMLSRGIKAAPGKGNYSYRICAGVSRSVLEKAVNRIIEVFQK